MSKREEIRKKRQQEARQQQLLLIGVVAVVAVIVAGIIIWPNIQPVADIVVPVAEEFPQADGKALGPQDARAVIQEFSDFQ